MKSTATYTLQRTMIVYFLLIGFAAFMVGIEFLVDTHQTELRNTLLANFEQFTAGAIDQSDLFAPVDKLGNKALLMIGVIVAVVVIVLTMFIKNITEPLQHMIEEAGEISAGNLSRTISIQSENELAELGNLINDMSSNLQEMLLLTGNTCRPAMKAAAGISRALESDHIDPSDLPAMRQQVQRISTELEGLCDIIDYFSFYRIDEPDHNG